MPAFRSSRWSVYTDDDLRSTVGRVIRRGIQASGFGNSQRYLRNHWKWRDAGVGVARADLLSGLYAGTYQPHGCAYRPTSHCNYGLDRMRSNAGKSFHLLDSRLAGIMNRGYLGLVVLSHVSEKGG
jgi:hypothetical protein